MGLDLEARNRLVDLLAGSGKAGADSRSALCERIGVESNILSFISGGSAQDFATMLVKHLNDSERYRELIALCDEIAPVLGPGKQKALMAIRTKLEKLISQPEESPDGDKQPEPPPSPEHQSIVELVNEACASIQRACEVLDQPYLFPRDCREVIRFLEEIKQLVDDLWKELNNKNFPSETLEKLYSKVIFDRHSVNKYIPELVLQLKQFDTECLSITPETQSKHQQIREDSINLRSILRGWQTSSPQVSSEKIDVDFVALATAQQESSINWSRLTDDDFDCLVDLLLKCSTMQNSDTRGKIVHRLGNIAHVIKRGNTSITDIWAIVSTCRNYVSGLDELINSVRFFEKKSIPMNNILEFLKRFQG